MTTQDAWITMSRRLYAASGRAFLTRVADRYFALARKGTNARIGLDAYKVAYACQFVEQCPWGEAGTWKLGGLDAGDAGIVESLTAVQPATIAIGRLNGSTGNNNQNERN